VLRPGVHAPTVARSSDTLLRSRRPVSATATYADGHASPTASTFQLSPPARSAVRAAAGTATAPGPPPRAGCIVGRRTVRRGRRPGPGRWPGVARRGGDPGIGTRGPAAERRPRRGAPPDRRDAAGVRPVRDGRRRGLADPRAIRGLPAHRAGALGRAVDRRDLRGLPRRHAQSADVAAATGPAGRDAGPSGRP